MLADYKMRKDIEKLQNEVNADARASTIHRMVQGSKSSNFAHFSLNTKSTDEYTRGDDDGDDDSDDDIDKEDEHFMEAYRQQRLLEIEKGYREKIFGSVDMVIIF